MYTNAAYKIILPIKGKDRNKYNYVYQITELSTRMKYIGSIGCKLDMVYIGFLFLNVYTLYRKWIKINKCR